LLYQALTTLDTAVLGDVRAHFRQPSSAPNPAGPDDANHPLLGHLNKLLEASGLSDPLAKLYVVTEPVESLPTLLLFFVVTYVTKLAWDKDFATLVRLKPTFGLDGMPLVVGTSTLLKQFHPSYTKRLLEYLGQFVRCTVAGVLEKAKASSGGGGSDAGGSSRGGRAPMPPEVTNTLLFIDMFCKVGQIPKSAVAEFVPSYILDSVEVA
jgi:WASH complex subunit strumpellin